MEVRRSAVPGGGFVLIYGDVTERKRSEEQVRAARDPAETASGELRTAQASLMHAHKIAALELTRSLDTPLVVGGALVEAIAAAPLAEATALLERLQDEGEQVLRGRSGAVRIWIRRRPV